MTFIANGIVGRQLTTSILIFLAMCKRHMNLCVYKRLRKTKVLTHGVPPTTIMMGRLHVELDDY